TYKKVRFLNCYHSVVIDNIQALNFQFLGCDFEAHSMITNKPFFDSTVFTIKKGGMVNVIGGSIIVPGTTIYLRPTGNAVLKRSQNAVYNFIGVRWEMLNNNERNVLFRNEGIYISTNDIMINIDKSQVFQRNEATGNYIGYVYDNHFINIRDTLTSDAKIKGFIKESTQNTYGRLFMENVSKITYEESRSGLAIEQKAIVHHVSSFGGFLNNSLLG